MVLEDILNEILVELRDIKKILNDKDACIEEDIDFTGCQVIMLKLGSNTTYNKNIPINTALNYVLDYIGRTEVLKYIPSAKDGKVEDYNYIPRLDISFRRLSSNNCMKVLKEIHKVHPFQLQLMLANGNTYIL